MHGKYRPRPLKPGEPSANSVLTCVRPYLRDIYRIMKVDFVILSRIFIGGVPHKETATPDFGGRRRKALLEDLGG